ncbi:sporulation-induced protein [Elasticomyces elasticus]|nr:sporulation-induced protein [Elasticomyces elasticus]
MFWRFGGYANISTLDSILDKPDVTVEDLLDESEVIQELKQQNSKLIEFLRTEPVLEKLLRYVTAPQTSPGEEEQPAEGEEKSTGISFFGKGKGRARSKSVNKGIDYSEAEEEKREEKRKKYAYVACEILSSEVWSISEALMEQKQQLRDFWGYMHKPAPLDALQAGYFTKVNEALLDKRTEDMLIFFKNLDGIVPAMLQHVDCPMVMDLLLKIISLEKHEGGQGIVDWLQSQDLIPKLLSYLSLEHSSATQTSAGDFLKAIITISANATTQDQSVIGPNELTRQLVSETCISHLISQMLKGGNPLTVGVGIIIEVIRKNNSDYDLDNQVGPDPKTSDPIYLGTLLREFAKRVPDFMDLIRSPASKKKELKAAFGEKIEPLGFDRFKTCELMAELLHCSNMGLLNERGSEAEVKRRDAERERLKAEGKLVTPRAISPSEDKFSSSVDSHGFHHAEMPSDDLNDSADEIKRLEVQNVSDEDGFEKVGMTESERYPDEVSFEDLNDNVEQTGLPPLEKHGNSYTIHDQTDDMETIELSSSPSDTNSHPIYTPTSSRGDANSPTTMQIAGRLADLNLDTETGMDDEHSPLGSPPTSYAARLSPHPEDKPAPLFARKDTKEQNGDDLQMGPVNEEDEDELERSSMTIHGEQTGYEMSPDARPPYEEDVDGGPVVGDFLKMQFVEHQVVPTILDFFFRFPWNNFLHNVVYDVVQQVFNGTLDRGYNRTLALDLFTPSPIPATKPANPSRPISPASAKSPKPPTMKSTPTPAPNVILHSNADITQRCIDGQYASDRAVEKKTMRLGYMGHLTLISDEIVKFVNRNPPEVLGEVVMERVMRDEWVCYATETLVKTQEKDNAALGGGRPDTSSGIAARAGLGMGLSSMGQSSFGSNTGSTALSNAGLSPTAGNTTGLDSLDLLNNGSSGGGNSYEIHGGNVLSGFNNSSDEDDEMEEESRESPRIVEDDENVGELSFDEGEMVGLR